jgi:nucleotide-binding universal stress UspA family protein
MKAILVATDGSAPARRAFATALELAEPAGASLVLLHVAADPDVAADGRLAELRTEAERRGVACRVEIVEGDPVETILSRAEALDADLVVIGSRGRGSVAEEVLGSVSSGVLHGADRPVLIVRANRPAGGAAPP